MRGRFGAGRGGKIGGARLGTIILILAAVLMTVRAWRGEVSLSEASGPFDYYVMAMSWSPSYCRDNPDRDQCGRGETFILHGLWPQFEEGWPENCDTGFTGPDRRTVAAAIGATPSEGLIRHQWRKHGTCSGMSAADYFATAREAFDKIVEPDLLGLSNGRDLSSAAVEDAFLDANPRLTPDAVTVKCRDGRLSEVRICLTKDLGVRTCGSDAIRDCRAGRLEIPAPR